MVARQITTRRITFGYDEDNLPQHFAGGDLVMSHVVAMLSAMFPNGEDFFVASVRNYRDRVTDPELKHQVGRFIGQEAIHGREHRVLNDRLHDMGYITHFVDRSVDIGLNRFAARVLPRSIQLAVTAALEHYTATLAETLLSDATARDMLDGEVRNLLLWHALEEAEHKAVAFDVYRAVCGNRLRGHLIRTVTMDVVTALFLLAIVDATRRSMRHDPVGRDRTRRRASLCRLRHSPFLTKAVRARIRDYNRRDFHPDDHQTDQLLAEWRETLFGSSGALRDRLSSSAA